MNTRGKLRGNPVISILAAGLVLLPLVVGLWQMRAVPLSTLLGAPDQLSPTNAVIWAFRGDTYREYDINTPTDLTELTVILNATKASDLGKTETIPADDGVYRVYLVARTPAVNEDYEMFTLAASSGRVYCNGHVYSISSQEAQMLFAELTCLTDSD